MREPAHWEGSLERAEHRHGRRYSGRRQADPVNRARGVNGASGVASWVSTDGARASARWHVMDRAGPLEWPDLLPEFSWGCRLCGRAEKRRGHEVTCRLEAVALRGHTQGHVRPS